MSLPSLMRHATPKHRPRRGGSLHFQRSFPRDICAKMHCHPENHVVHQKKVSFIKKRLRSRAYVFIMVSEDRRRESDEKAYLGYSVYLHRHFPFGLRRFVLRGIVESHLGRPVGALFGKCIPYRCSCMLYYSKCPFEYLSCAKEE